jgi:hypothetical protein
MLTVPGLVELHAGEYKVTVYAEDRAGNLALRTRNFTHTRPPGIRRYRMTVHLSAPQAELSQ